MRKIFLEELQANKISLFLLFRFIGERLALLEIKAYIRKFLESSDSINVNSRITSGELKLQTPSILDTYS